MSIAAIALVAAPLAARAPGDAKGAIVLFAPGMSQGQIMMAVESIGARMVWTDRSGGLWALELDGAGSAQRLYGRGALLVSNSFLPAGCLDWSRPVLAL